MMMNVRHRYTQRHFIDLPTVVIVFLWVAIWFLWALVDNGVLLADGQDTCRIRFVDIGKLEAGTHRDPTKFAFPVLPPTILDDDTSVDADRPARTVDRSRILKRSPKSPGGSVRDFIDLSGDNAASLARGYRMRWEDRGGPVSGESFVPEGVRIQVSDLLKKMGYYIPSYALESIRKLEGSWEATLQVDINEEGATEHVFLLSGSGDKRINSDIVRILYQGALYVSGRKCSGLVTISSGKNK